jgi:major membrane immunogen (membrane-anchored lipoprotein)
MAKVSSMAAVGLLTAFLLTGCGTLPPSPDEAGSRSAADHRYSNKWRIEVSEGANSDGEFVFHVTPRDGETQVVTIEIDDGESENHVARTIKNGFEDQLDTGDYDIEMDDGEDVLIKKDTFQPDFALEIISSTVKSVRLKVERE